MYNLNHLLVIQAREFLFCHFLSAESIQPFHCDHCNFKVRGVWRVQELPFAPPSELLEGCCYYLHLELNLRGKCS